MRDTARVLRRPARLAIMPDAPAYERVNSGLVDVLPVEVEEESDEAPGIAEPYAAPRTLTFRVSRNLTSRLDK